MKLASWIWSLFGRSTADPESGFLRQPAWIWAKVSTNAKLVFLDFDGVMHRAENGSFERLPQLETLLAQLPDAMVVISSNWRINASRQYLLSHFPPALHSRIVGVTPQMPDGNPAQRERECRRFAEHLAIRHYVAIDDEANLFSTNCGFLIQTDRYEGLVDSVVEQCVARLA